MIFGNQNFERAEKLIRKEKEIVNLQQLIDAGVLEDSIKVLKVIKHLSDRLDENTRYSSAREIKYALAATKEECMDLCDIDLNYPSCAVSFADLFEQRCNEQLEKEREEMWNKIQCEPLYHLNGHKEEHIEPKKEVVPEPTKTDSIVTDSMTIVGNKIKVSVINGKLHIEIPKEEQFTVSPAPYPTRPPKEEVVSVSPKVEAPTTQSVTTTAPTLFNTPNVEAPTTQSAPTMFNAPVEEQATPKQRIHTQEAPVEMERSKRARAMMDAKMVVNMPPAEAAAWIRKVEEANGCRISNVSNSNDPMDLAAIQALTGM